MKIQVRMFAAARDLAGSEWVEVELAEGATVQQLRESLASSRPELARLLRHTLLAVNAEYVAGQSVIPPDAEVACIPPVSGG